MSLGHYPISGAPISGLAGASAPPPPDTYISILGNRRDKQQFDPEGFVKPLTAALTVVLTAYAAFNPAPSIVLRKMAQVWQDPEVFVQPQRALPVALANYSTQQQFPQSARRTPVWPDDPFVQLPTRSNLVTVLTSYGSVYNPAPDIVLRKQAKDWIEAEAFTRPQPTAYQIVLSNYSVKQQFAQTGHQDKTFIEPDSFIQPLSRLHPVLADYTVQKRFAQTGRWTQVFVEPDAFVQPQNRLHPILASYAVAQLFAQTGKWDKTFVEPDAYARAAPQQNVAIQPIVVPPYVLDFPRQAYRAPRLISEVFQTSIPPVSSNALFGGYLPEQWFPLQIQSPKRHTFVEPEVFAQSMTSPLVVGLTAYAQYNPSPDKVLRGWSVAWVEPDSYWRVTQPPPLIAVLTGYSPYNPAPDVVLRSMARVWQDPEAFIQPDRPVHIELADYTVQNAFPALIARLKQVFAEPDADPRARAVALTTVLTQYAPYNPSPDLILRGLRAVWQDPEAFVQTLPRLSIALPVPTPPPAGSRRNRIMGGIWN